MGRSRDVIGTNGRNEAAALQRQNSRIRFPRNGNYNNRHAMVAVPSWEKQFCLKVGLFTWEKFLAAKKDTEFYDKRHKVRDWNASEAENAFHNAKKRFLALLERRPDNYLGPDPDLYIDQIKWDEEDDGTSEELLRELELAKIPRVDLRRRDEPGIRMEDIKPTGWDSHVHCPDDGDPLTGLIVGSWL